MLNSLCTRTKKCINKSFEIILKKQQQFPINNSTTKQCINSSFDWLPEVIVVECIQILDSVDDRLLNYFVLWKQFSPTILLVAMLTVLPARVQVCIKKQNIPPNFFAKITSTSLCHIAICLDTTTTYTKFYCSYTGAWTIHTNLHPSFVTSIADWLKRSPLLFCSRFVWWLSLYHSLF